MIMITSSLSIKVEYIIENGNEIGVPINTQYAILVIHARQGLMEHTDNLITYSMKLTQECFKSEYTSLLVPCPPLLPFWSRVSTWYLLSVSDFGVLANYVHVSDHACL